MTGRSEPLFSIVVATHNAAGTLLHCLDALVAQRCQIFELVVQDSVSTDDTCAIVEHYASSLPACSLESVPDNGIYDAWNRAVRRCRGEWLLFLGADDKLHDESVLERLLPVVREVNDGIRYISSPCVLINKQGTPYGMDVASNAFMAELPHRMALPNPSLLYRRVLFVDRQFDVRWRIAGDYAFVAASATQENVLRQPYPLSDFLLGGVSNRLENFWNRELEHLAISKTFFPNGTRWPLYKRLGKALAFKLLSQLFSPDTATRMADVWRAMTGRTKLWSLK